MIVKGSLGKTTYFIEDDEAGTSNVTVKRVNGDGTRTIIIPRTLILQYVDAHIMRRIEARRDKEGMAFLGRYV